MQVYLLIDNSTVKFELDKETEQPKGSYTYSASYTTSSLASSSITFISTPIMIDPQGSSIVEFKMTRLYTKDDINELKNRVYSDGDETNCNKNNSINSEDLERLTSLTRLQIKHRFPKYCGNLEEVSPELSLFTEYLLLQSNSNGDVVQLYPDFPLDTSKYTVVDMNYIRKIDEIDIGAKKPILSTLLANFTVL